MPTKIAREIIGSEKIIGRSTHCLKDIKKAEEEGSDYIGIGPIFPSKTKQILQPIGVKAILEVFDQTYLPAFAIGGINSTNISQLSTMKNKKIAVSDVIMNANDPFSTTQELFKLLK